MIAGKLGVRLNDGTTYELEPDDVYEIPPGHDAYVLGSEPVIAFEWAGINVFYGHRRPLRGGRALTTLMFTDLVASTEIAQRLGDIAWRAVLSAHFEVTRRELDRFGGREVRTTGDGMLAHLRRRRPGVALRAERRPQRHARRPARSCHRACG